MIDAHVIQMAVEGLPVPLCAGWFWIYAAVQAYASLKASQAAASAQRDAAKSAEYQGEIAVMQSEFQAKAALQAGRDQAEYIRQQSAEVVGSRVTRTAAGGVELSGSPMAVISTEIWAGEKAAANAIKNSNARAGQIEAQGLATEATANANASAMRTQADYTEQASWLKAVAAGMSAYAGYQGMSGGGASPSQPSYGPPAQGSTYYRGFGE